VEEAQEAICPPHRVYEPEESEQRVYEDLYALYRELYFAFGKPGEDRFSKVLPTLIKTAEAVNSKSLSTVVSQ